MTKRTCLDQQTDAEFPNRIELCQLVRMETWLLPTPTPPDTQLVTVKTALLVWVTQSRVVCVLATRPVNGMLVQTPLNLPSNEFIQQEHM